MQVPNNTLPPFFTATYIKYSTKYSTSLSNMAGSRRKQSMQVLVNGMKCGPSQGVVLYACMGCHRTQASLQKFDRLTLESG